MQVVTGNFDLTSQCTLKMEKKKGGDVCESGGVGNLKGEVLLCGFLFKTGFEQRTEGLGNRTDLCNF